jgi:hypothetical protein
MQAPPELFVDLRERLAAVPDDAFSQVQVMAKRGKHWGLSVVSCAELVATGVVDLTQYLSALLGTPGQLTVDTNGQNSWKIKLTQHFHVLQASSANGHSHGNRA